MSRYFMAIDIGTTGGRACIFDDEGELTGSAYSEFESHYPNPGWVEQYPEEMLPALHDSCRKAIAASGLRAEQIEAVAFSSAGAVLSLMDEQFELISPFISWQDIRGVSQYENFLQKLQDVGEYHEETGGLIAISSPVTKILWLKNEMPEAWEKATYLGSQIDYFNLRFGAEKFAVDLAVGSRYGVMDIHSASYNEELIKRLGVDGIQYPEIVPCGTVIGEINKDTAEKTGLIEGTKLVMGSLDQNASSMGMGMLKHGQAGFTLGTAGLMTTIIDKPQFHSGQKMIIKPNASVGNYTVEGLSMASASAYRWYRDELCKAERDASDRIGVDTYDIMNHLARKSKPGANGVTFLNFLQGAGGVLHDYRAKGTFTGLTFSTTKGDMTRAVMEGIVYEEKWMLDAIKDMGIEVTELRLAGGGAKSRTWCQMHADIIGLPVVLMQNPELSALGAAMLAGVGVGAFASIEDAIEKCVHIDKTYMPNPKYEKAYQKAYRKYQECYDAMSKGNIWN